MKGRSTMENLHSCVCCWFVLQLLAREEIWTDCQVMSNLWHHWSTDLKGKKRKSRALEQKRKQNGRKMHCCLSQTVRNYRLWQGPTSQQQPPCCAHHGKNYSSRSSFSTCTLWDSYGSTGHLSCQKKPCKTRLNLFLYEDCIVDLLNMMLL